VGKRNLDDVRGDIRDGTRTKERRKATVAQKEARDRAGHSARRPRPPKGESRPQRHARSPRPPGPQPSPSRNATVAKAAKQRLPTRRQTPLPVQQDDFKRLNLRDVGGKEHSIERPKDPDRAVPARELPDTTSRKPVTTEHAYTVSSVQADALRDVRDGTAGRTKDTDALDRAGLAARSGETYRLTPQGQRVLQQLERQGDATRSQDAPRDADDARQTPTRVVLEERYQLSPAQLRTLDDLGTFRVAREDAISRTVYGRDEHGDRAEAPLADLKNAGLVAELRQGDASYLSLTPAGRDVLAAEYPDRHNIHTGIPRSSQARHDAAIYDAYQHAERDIRPDSGQVRRVLLEEDLKSEIRREAYISAAQVLRARGLDIKTVTDPERNLAIREATAPIAQAHGLPVDDDGAVMYPDMQLEIDRPDGTVGRCNVEVVTEHYSESTLGAKHAAGLQLYLPSTSSGARGGGGGVPVQSLADELLDF
jgi:hypothetical protein